MSSADLQTRMDRACPVLKEMASQGSSGRSLSDAGSEGMVGTESSQGEANASFKTEINKRLVVKRVTVSADASSGIEVALGASYTIVDVLVLATATSSGGTIQVKDGAETPAAITNAIACAAGDTLSRAASIDPDTATTNTVTIVANGSTDRGVITLLMV